MNKMTFAFAVAALGLFSVAQAAVTIPTSKRLGPVPSTDGTGLTGQVWTGATTVHDTAAAAAWATSHTAAGTFTAKSFNYSNQSETNTVGNLLGSDASGLSTAVKNATSVATVYSFVGKIALPTSGTYQFRITSDDGFVMKIGDQKVAEFAGERSSATTDAFVTVNQSGLYAIDILYFNGPSAGNLKIEYGKVNSNNYCDKFEILGKPELYTTPVPTPGAVAVLGMGGLMAGRRRRA